MNLNSFKKKVGEDVKAMGGHVLNDQLISPQSLHRNFIKGELQTFEKFTGLGDAEQWLISLLMKLDLLQVDMDDRITFVPVVLTGEAFIWYIQNTKHMSTFISFAELFLQRFSSTEMENGKPTATDPILIQQQLTTKNGTQDDVFSSLRNQLLLGHIEKLPKFSGRSKQNVFQWLEELEQAIQIFELTDELKLLVASSLLEDVASDWFFDNIHLFSTWTSFTEKFIKIFKPPGTIYVPTDQLCLFTHDVKRNVTITSSTSMKLNETENNSNEQILGSINQHEFMVHPIQDQQISPSMANIVSDSISIVSAEVSLDINGELLFNAVELEQPTIQTQEMDFTSTFAESFNALIVEKLTTIDSTIKVRSEFNESRMLSDKYMRIILCQIINKSQFIRPTTIKMIRIGIDLTINMYREVSKMDWCGNCPFDPGGSVMVEHNFGYTNYPFNCSFILCFFSRYLYLSMSKFVTLFTFLGLRYSFVIISGDLFI